jgi:antirestriction protein ArdC
MKQKLSPQVKAKIKQRVEAHKAKLAETLLERLFAHEELGEWSPEWSREYMQQFNIPWNPVTRWRYSGGNMFFLSLSMLMNGWEDSRFITFNQMVGKKILSDDKQPLRIKDSERKKGMLMFQPVPIKKGHKKKTEVEVNKEQYINGQSEQTEEEKEAVSQDTFIVFRPFTVYNAEQFENFPSFDIKQDFRVSWNDWSVIEDFVRSSKIKVEQTPSVPSYSPITDKIHIPPKKSFKTAEGYYVTLLHEWFHATGHESRTNRLKRYTEKDFSSKVEYEKAIKRDYAIEELRSEMFSMLVSDFLGFNRFTRSTETVENIINSNIRYIQSWLAKLDEKEKVSIVIKCFENASEMLDVFTSYLIGQQPTRAPWFPPKSEWIRDEAKISVQIPDMLQEEQQQEQEQEQEQEEYVKEEVVGIRE